MMSRKRTTRTGLAVAALATAALVVPAAPASAAPDTACQRAGMNTLRSLELLDDVARSGLPISTAVGYNVTLRDPSTDLSALPDPLPLRVVLADHRAGDNSIFIYPWC